jgi:hypothetical protein
MATTSERLKRKQYEKALRELQVELCALQDSPKFLNEIRLGELFQLQIFAHKLSQFLRPLIMLRVCFNEINARAFATQRANDVARYFVHALEKC